MFTIHLAALLATAVADPTVGLEGRTLTVSGLEILSIEPPPNGSEGGWALFGDWMVTDGPVVFDVEPGETYILRGLTTAENPLEPQRAYFAQQVIVPPLTREQDIVLRLTKAQQAYIDYRLAMGELQQLQPTNAEIEAAMQAIEAREAVTP